MAKSTLFILFIIVKKKAPDITGKLKINDNLIEFSKLRPINLEPTIMLAERLTPGINARQLNSPITKSFFLLISYRLWLSDFNLSVNISIIPNINVPIIEINPIFWSNVKME